MKLTGLTERQRREQAFYAQYAHRQEVDQVDYGPAITAESRPWNAYWFVYEYLRNRVGQKSGQQRVLDFGCGIGIAAMRFARMGYTVDGFDISEENLTVARKLASRERLSTYCAFESMVAEDLHYPDATFDYVVGIDILHHIDIPRAVSEAYRVLKPGGVAIFKEHVEVPAYDWLRNTGLVRMLVPNESSLDDHITEDEHKLTRDDVAVIQECFDAVETKKYTLLSRLDRMVPCCSDAMRGRIQKLDYQLMNLVPGLQRVAGTAVYVCYKSEQSAIVQPQPLRLAA